MSIEPLPDELRRMIEAEPNVPLAPEVEARLLARLDASTSAAFASVQATPSTGGPRSSVVKGVAIFIAGAVSGAVVTKQLEPAPAPPPPIIREVPTIREPAPAPVEVSPVVPAPAVTPPSVPKPRAVEPRSPPLPFSTLDAERRLLEPARTALSRSMAATALEVIERHAREYPTGALAEERDALRVQALAVGGDLPAARVRAAEFARNYPDSLLLPVVERAVQGSHD